MLPLSWGEEAPGACVQIAAGVVAMIDGLLLDALIDVDPQAPNVAAAGVARLLLHLEPRQDSRSKDRPKQTGG